MCVVVFCPFFVGNAVKCAIYQPLTPTPNKDTEGVDSMLRTLLPNDQYFRFNPSIEPFDIDEIRYGDGYTPMYAIHR